MVSTGAEVEHVEFDESVVGQWLVFAARCTDCGRTARAHSSREHAFDDLAEHTCAPGKGTAAGT